MIKRIIINNIANQGIIPSRIRKKLYYFCGFDFNKLVEVRANLFLNNHNIFIDEGSFINRNVQMHSGHDEKDGISIGKNCFIGMNVNLCCISHQIGDFYQRAGVNTYGSITI